MYVLKEDRLIDHLIVTFIASSEYNSAKSLVKFGSYEMAAHDGPVTMLKTID